MTQEIDAGDFHVVFKVKADAAAGLGHMVNGVNQQY
jgi:hypothetical protein